MATVDPEVARALTDPRAYANASMEVINECVTHIHDAIRQVQGAKGKAERQAMLEKLPPHIRDRVEEWVRVCWDVDIMASASIDCETRDLPLWGIRVMVRKKGP